ncbi:large subunit ribosomal protein L24e [Nematocida sp. LUAm3]|nr:large subunit ribosomal protein L24e [Nematocida sp. LUAm3]KAI5175411.1 large subunit ribosomal protein L24e [Nematocida sp. LUAm2]KAI5177632.1 large subunit ribosomal protein L24e [Nematocida sp. LUAm1]
MKYGICSFSGHAIYRGKGRIVVLGNGSAFLFGKGKGRRYFEKKMNPKKLGWTMASRISRKKATAFKTSKVQAPKVVKPIRSFVGLSLEELKSKIASEKPQAPASTSTRANRRNKDKIQSIAKNTTQ